MKLQFIKIRSEQLWNKRWSKWPALLFMAQIANFCALFVSFSRVLENYVVIDSGSWRKREEETVLCCHTFLVFQKKVWRFITDQNEIGHFNKSIIWRSISLVIDMITSICYVVRKRFLTQCHCLIVGIFFAKFPTC